TQRSITVNSFHGIFRTCRHIAARRREQRRDRPLVGAEQLNNHEFGIFFHASSAEGSEPAGKLFCFPLHDLEGSLYFLQQLSELGREQRLLRVNHYVGRHILLWPAETDRLPQAPLHTITINRPA